MADYIKEDAFRYLGVTQEQYNTIKQRWCDQDLISHDQPFVWDEDNPYFRAWNPTCLNDPFCRNVLENEIGISNLPDFSAYTKSSPVRHQQMEINFFEYTFMTARKAVVRFFTPITKLVLWIRNKLRTWED